MPRRSRRATRKSGGGFFDFLFGSSEEKKNNATPMNAAYNMATGNFVEAVVESPGAANTVSAPASVMLGGRRRKASKKSRKSRKSRKASKKSRKALRSRRH